MLAIMNNTKDRFHWVDWMINEREKKGWSQADLARESGLTRTAISDYEKRQRANPQVDALKRISVALGYPADYLLKLANGMESEESDPLIEAGLYVLRKLRADQRAGAVRILQTQLEVQEEQEKNARRKGNTAPLKPG